MFIRVVIGKVFIVGRMSYLVHKVLSTFIGVTLTSFALFSMLRISGQPSFDGGERDELIARALMKSEMERVQALDGYPVVVLEQPSAGDSGGQGGSGGQASLIRDPAPVIPGEANEYTGEVEILSASVLSLGLPGGEALPVLLGEGVLDQAADFVIQDGDVVTVSGSWSESGSFIAEVLVSELNGVLDVIAVRAAMEEEAPPVEDLQSFEEQGTGAGRGNRGQGYRGGN